MKNFEIIEMYRQFKNQLIKQAAIYTIDSCEIEASEVEVDDIKNTAMITFQKLIKVINRMNKEVAEIYDIDV